VATISQNSNDRQAHDAVIYSPYRQQAGRSMWVIVRATPSSATFTTTLRREVHAIDADLAIWIGPFALTDLMAAMGNYWRLGDNAALFLVFALVALCLASIGLYAVVAHSVNRRTQEIGIRIAIGATARDILTLVFRQGMLPCILGLAIGAVASFAVTPVLETQLVRVSAVDPLSLVAAAAVLLLAAAFGCLLPASRAMRVNPVVALRHD
jgi:ABC-type antimicrobial peptide transport system permease subunit